LTFSIAKRSLPKFILSHSTLLMALSKVEGPGEGVEMTKAALRGVFGEPLEGAFHL
jgi:hypothetical protein